eukprot:604086-Pyramimonas_sp.AAC.1
MAPKCAMAALPPPCEQLKKPMLEMGAEVNETSVEELGGGVERSAEEWRKMSTEGCDMMS